MGGKARADGGKGRLEAEGKGGGSAGGREEVVDRKRLEEAVAAYTRMLTAHDTHPWSSLARWG